MIAALLAVATACVCVGCAVIARHRVQAAADLAALAGAGQVARGAAAACGQAATVASGMRTVVATCVVDELDVIVTAEVAVRLGRFGIGTARAVARAGPGA